LNIKGIISALTSAVLNQAQQNLSLQVSFFGIYLKESSGRRAVIGVFEYLVNLGTTLLISAFAIYYFLANTNILLRDLGAILSVLICCLLMSPAHKTDFSNFYSFMDFKFKDKKTPIFLITQLRIMFLNSTGLFLLLALSFFLLSIFTLAQYIGQWPIMAIIVILMLGFFLDLLDDLDFILDQFQGYFISPLRTFFSHLRETDYDILKLLKNVPIFESLAPEVLSEMTKVSKVISLRKGVTLCKEGQDSTNLYLMIKGCVGIYKSGERNSKFKVLELISGSVFGEGGFFLNKPRTGDAITLTDSIILRISRPQQLKGDKAIPADMAEIFQKKIWAFQALSRSNFFQDVPPELLMQIVTESKLYDLPIDSMLIKKGDLSDSMWIVLEGESRAVDNGIEKRHLKIGDVFGEIGIIWNTRRTATVTTITKSTLLRIDAEVLRRILSTNISLGVALQKLGTDRLNSDN
jgi:CRP/FNR family cyclic AMP-dependent transcriptional regulator